MSVTLWNNSKSGRNSKLHLHFIRIVGQGTACNASYALTVANRTAPGTSRSVQRGTASVRPGAPATFATSTLAGAATGKWTAQLAVRGCGADAQYEESSGASATAG